MRKINWLNTLKKCTLVFAALYLALLPVPAMAIDEEFYSSNDILFYNPDLTCKPEPTSTTSSVKTSIDVTIAQANIKNNYGSTSQAERYVKAINLFSSHNPDFITLNEIHTPKEQLTHSKYKVFGKRHPGANTVEDRGVRIAWDSSRWKRITGGIEQIHPSVDASNPISGRDRYAVWATFQNKTNDAAVSVISTHWNVNSQNFPSRSKKAGENLNTLVQTLAADSQVFIGGDFNFPLNRFSEAHSPAEALKSQNLKSGFKKPQDKDVNIDTVFYPKHFDQSKKQTYSKSQTSHISDHPFIVTKLSGDANTATVDSKGCVCSTSSTSGGLVGGKNEEKIFNYFMQKGLSDVQSAGIIGNISVESAFDPERIQGKQVGEGSKDPNDAGSGGWGLIQWTPGSKVITAAKDAGLDSNSIHELSTQLDLIWGHMQNNPPITKGSFSVPEYKKITDIEKATYYFEDKIEGAGTPNYPDRYTAARLALDQFSGGASTTPIDSVSTGSVSDCGDIGDGAAAGNAAKTAINYAWSDYRQKGTKGSLDLKPAYKKAVDAAMAKGEYVGGINYKGVDCGGFVTLAMKNSGVDPEYGGGGNTTSQLSHLESSGKYKEIKNPTTADMIPGAIAIRSGGIGDGGSGHTYMYVGNNPGFETQIASASLDNRAPMAGKELVADPTYRWFILKDA